MVRVNDIIKRLFLILFVFMILYYPPFFSVNGMKLVGIVAWVLLIKNISGLSRNIRASEVIKVLFFSVCCITYILLIGVIYNNEFIPSIAGFIYLIMAFFPATIFVAYRAIQLKYDIYDFATLVLQAAMLQSILSLIAMLVPSIKKLFIESLISGGTFQESTYTAEIIFRLFGYSAGMTYAMPIVQAFLGSVSLYLAFEKNIKFFLFVPFLLVSAFVNSRTSAVVAGLCIMVVLFFQLRKISRKFLFNVFFIIMASMGIVSFLSKFIELAYPETYMWIATGYDELIRFSEGDSSSGYFFYMLDYNNWRLPNDEEFIFGTGTRIMSSNNRYNLNSDIGYVNDIWLMGIVVSFLWYIFWIERIISIKNNTFLHACTAREMGSYLCIAFFLTFFVVNVKGYIFDMNNFTALFLLFLSYCSLFKSTNYTTGKKADN